MDAQTPLKVFEDWGSIEEVVNRPLEDVPHDAWWISVILCWIFLPLTILTVLPVLCCDCALVGLGIGFFSCGTIFSALASVRYGNPFLLAPNMWRGQLGILMYFIKSKLTRLRLFYNEWQAYGGERFFFHGEGPWCVSHADVKTILSGPQMRQTAFGCVKAAAPDLFASNILIFLPNTGQPDCEWKAIRFALHQFLLADIGRRMPQLRGRIAAEWPSPALSDLDDGSKARTIIAKSVFFCLFGIWLDDDDAGTLSEWEVAAKACIFPRLIQRIAFNALVRRLKALRIATVGLIEKHQLQSIFVNMNNTLPPQYRRQPAAKLCDEVMFALAFAGVNGTCAALNTSAAFLQVKCPPESAPEMIDFSKYPTADQMMAVYKKDPYRYIKEACRLDAPVTSATTSFPEDQTVPLAGREVLFEKGNLMQYTIALANRDEKVFSEPSLFNPDRPELDMAVTFNGLFGPRTSIEQDERAFPRICPGRYFALDVVKTVLDYCLGEMHP